MALALTLQLFTAPTPPCPPPLIHTWGVLCVTETEWQTLHNPPPPVPPPPSLPAQGVERWRPIVEHFWNEPHTSRMLKIMRCESGGDPNAWNKKTDVRGLFQVRYPIWSKPWPGDYFDPWTNAAIAYQVWLEQGYRAWACRG